MLTHPFLGLELDPFLRTAHRMAPLALAQRHFHLPRRTPARQVPANGAGVGAVERFTLRKCNGRALHWGTLNHNLMDNPTRLFDFPRYQLANAPQDAMMTMPNEGNRVTYSTAEVRRRDGPREPWPHRPGPRFR